MMEEKIDIEKGEVSKEQLKAIQEGKWHTIKEIAVKFGFTTAWISYLCQKGRIKAVKPTGGGWRIPSDEFEKIMKEGIPPLPRIPPAPVAREIKVPPEKLEKIMGKKEEKKEEGNVPFPWSIFKL